MVDLEQEVIVHLLEMIALLALVFGRPTLVPEVTEEVVAPALNVVVLVQKVMRL